MPRLIAILVIFLNTYLPVFGQTAPDFTFTDITGTTHNLQHALDQDYIIVVEFFFSDCGPCITSAMELQAIQEDYTDQNVLVWSISPIDNDERILQFHADMELNYIAGGIEGGGIDVFNLFCEDNIFVAYPTIAVICPDGDLTWDIYPYSMGAPEWRMSIEKCGVEDVAPYEPFGSLTAEVSQKNLRAPTFFLAPNPTSDFVNLTFAESVNVRKIEVEIYNSVGQLVKKIARGTVNSRNQEMQISTGELENGVYFVKVNPDQKQGKLQRLIVLR